MAPSPTYQTPPQQLGMLMVIARRAGLAFEDFWAQAVRPTEPLVMANDVCPPAGAVRWPTDPRDRAAWREAVIGTCDGWQRAYEREEPSGPERAVCQLAEFLSESAGDNLIAA